MAYKRVLTVQDISCVGQCSLTVALPILSAAGHEACVLPSAVLSAHTAFRAGFTFRDLTDDMPKVAAHWKRERITFDAVYTGYLGNAKQVDLVLQILEDFRRPGAVSYVDPAMADNGRLYTGFDKAFVEEMRKLVFAADVILPNLTEACLLTGTEYREEYDEAYIRQMLAALHANGAKTVVLTGVSYERGTTGVVVSEHRVSIEDCCRENDRDAAEPHGILRFAQDDRPALCVAGTGHERGASGEAFSEDGSAGKLSGHLPEDFDYYQHKRFLHGSHGTGDVFASAFVGASLHGKTPGEAARIAADFTVRCLENTQDDPAHWYGVKFEPVLPYYMERLR